MGLYARGLRSLTRVMAAGLFRRVAGQILGEQGARAYETHVAFQHVDQLRQFVERSRPQPAAEGSQSCGVGQQMPGRVSRLGHRAKLEQRKNLPPFSWPRLAEEDRRAEFQANQQGDDEHHRPPQRG